MIKVYHFRHGAREGGAYNEELSAKVFLGLSKPAFTRENFRHVASVDTDDPEAAYRATQNLNGSWSKLTPGVMSFEESRNIDREWWMHPYTEVPAELQHERLRSTSVGDVLELEGGKLLRCASAGWEEV